MSSALAVNENIGDIDYSDFIWEEWEEYKGDVPFWQHTFCGSVAGIMEHVCMYPLDTMKTYFQANGALNTKNKNLNKCCLYECSEERIGKVQSMHLKETDINGGDRISSARLEKKLAYANSICESCVNKPCIFRKEFLLHGKVCPNMSTNMLYRNHSSIPYIHKKSLGRFSCYVNNSNNYKNENALKISSRHLNVMHILTTLKKRKKLKNAQSKYASNNSNKELKHLNKSNPFLQLSNQTIEKNANSVKNAAKEKLETISKSRSSATIFSEKHLMNRLKKRLHILKNLNRKSKGVNTRTKKYIRKNTRGNNYYRCFFRNNISMYCEEYVNKRNHSANKKTKNILLSTSSGNWGNVTGSYKFEPEQKVGKKYIYIENKYYSTYPLIQNDNTHSGGRLHSAISRRKCVRRTQTSRRTLVTNIKKHMPLEFLNDRYRHVELEKTGTKGYTQHTNSAICTQNIKSAIPLKNRNNVFNIKRIRVSTVHKSIDFARLNKNKAIEKIFDERCGSSRNALNTTKRYYFHMFPFTHNSNSLARRNTMSFFFDWKNKTILNKKQSNHFLNGSKSVLMQKFRSVEKGEKTQSGNVENIEKSKSKVYDCFKKHDTRIRCSTNPFFKDTFKKVLSIKENAKSAYGIGSTIKKMSMIIPKLGYNFKSFRLFNDNAITRNHKMCNKGTINIAISCTSMKTNILNLYKGVNVVILGCIPAHALYFSTFEYSKKYLQSVNISNAIPVDKSILKDSYQGKTPAHSVAAIATTSSYTEARTECNDSSSNGNITSVTPLRKLDEVNYMVIGISGILATVAHDAIVSPMDTIKQRIQLGINKGGFDTLKMLQENGLRSLYLSFPVTLLMNVPYQVIMMCTNEKMKKIYFEYLYNGHYSKSNADKIENSYIDPNDTIHANESFKKGLSQLKNSDTNDSAEIIDINSSRKLKKEIPSTNLIMSWIQEDLENENDSEIICHENEKQNIEEYVGKDFFSGTNKEMGKIENKQETEEKKETEKNILCYNTLADLSAFEKEKYVNLKNMYIKKDSFSYKNTNHITSYFVCAGIGGGVAAILTNPLDVIKTRIQTQHVDAKGFHFFRIVSNMYNKEGIGSFFKGSLARMTLCIPASAISWGSYETMKRFFKLQLNSS